MNHKHLFVLLLIALTPRLSAQQKIDFKGKDYPATPGWDFLCERYALTGKASVWVARTEKGGLLQLSVPTSDASFFIGGVVYVYLEDFSVIVCTDKNLRTRDGAQARSTYLFSDAEMQKLQKTRIASVRFNIRGKQTAFSSQIGNFTAVNQKSYFSTHEIKPQTFETESAIKALYTKP